MNLTDLANKLESLDEDAFANLLGLEYDHDEAPKRAKRLIIDALRFSEAHGFTTPRPSLDDAD